VEGVGGKEGEGLGGGEKGSGDGRGGGAGERRRVRGWEGEVGGGKQWRRGTSDSKLRAVRNKSDDTLGLCPWHAHGVTLPEPTERGLTARGKKRDPRKKAKLYQSANAG